MQLVVAFLLFDGRSDDATLQMMQQEGAFPRLVELIQDGGVNSEVILHRMLLELLYEMSRIQRLTWDDLSEDPHTLQDAGGDANREQCRLTTPSFSTCSG